jgi:hypothetical protein
VIIYGALNPNAQPLTVDVQFQVRALEVGDFIWDRDGRTEIAVLADDGSIHILQHGILDTRPLTAADIPGRRGAMMARSKQPRNPTSLGAWTEAKKLPYAGSAPSGPVSASAFSSPHLAASPSQDLMVLDAGQNRLSILDTSGKTESASADVSFPSAPLAALAMPTRINGERTTVILAAGQTEPMEMPNAGDPTFTVNTTADIDTINACTTSTTTVPSTLSLREAVCLANNSTPSSSTIDVPAGTYDLTSLETGELQIQTSGTGYTLSIVGTGAAPGDTIIQQTDGVDRLMEEDYNVSGNNPLTLQNLTLTGGNCTNVTTNDCQYGGGVMIAGGFVNDTLTLTSVVMSNNKVDATSQVNNGGAINDQGPAFTITNSTFSGNSGGPGGAIHFDDTELDDGTLTITGSTFTNNTSNQGGAVNFIVEPPYEMDVTGSNFTGNKSTGVAGPSYAQGGAFYGDMDTTSGGSSTFTNNRFANNVAEQAGTALSLNGIDFSVTLTDNWWGCNAGPGTPASDPGGVFQPGSYNTGCDTIYIDSHDGTTATTSPWLVLSIGANPTQIQANATSTLTASLTTNSNGDTGVTAPSGAGVTFGGTLGSANPTSGTLSGGQATSTFTAGSTGGTGSGTATVDNQTVSATIDIDLPPSFTTASSTTGNVNVALNFNVTATGYPSPALTVSNLQNAIPGVIIPASGTGTITLSGTPTATGTCTFTVTATNGVSPDATQNFTLTVDQSPSITSANSTTGEQGVALNFSVTATGYPSPALSVSNLQNPIPGVIIPATGTGTITLSGTPTASGTETFTITANNGVSPGVMQSITLTVVAAPSFTSANSATGTVSSPFNFMVGTTGGTGAVTLSVSNVQNPIPGINVPGSGIGTLALSGTPTASGTETFTITATDSVGGMAVQNFTLTVNSQQETLTIAANPAAGGSVTPTSGGSYSQGTSVPITATPNTGYTFLNWSSSPDAVAIATSASTTIPMNSNETVTAQFSANLVVNETTDDNPGVATNCVAQPTPGTTTNSDTCGLRDALIFAANAGSANISFDSTKFGTAQTITLGSAGTLTIPSNTAISGPASGSTATNLVTIAGGGPSSNFSVFTVNSGVTAASISAVAITNGGADPGGGINNGGTLTLTNSTISGNQATAQGGGINNSGTLTLVNSTISGNQAPTGSGISNQGTLTLIDSTISGNSAGGGTAGGLYINGGTVKLANTIISGNTASSAPDVSGSYTDNGGNVVGSSTISLASLANYGGPTQTMVPLPGSTAICAGTRTNATAAGLAEDQRGLPLPDPNCPSGSVDAGAVQSNYVLSFTTEPPTGALAGHAISPAPVVGLTESGATATIPTRIITMTDSNNLLSGTTTKALSSGLATFSNLVIPSATTSDQLTASLTLNAALIPPLKLPVQASTTLNVTAAVPATLTSPTATVLLGPAVTFNWSTAAGATGYRLLLGTTQGANNLFGSGLITATSATAHGLPTNGEGIYARLYTAYGAVEAFTDYTFTAATQSALTSPTATVLTGPKVTFNWTTAPGATGYRLLLGTTAGSNNLWGSGTVTATTTTAYGLPTNGEAIYATLYTVYGSVEVSADYTFTATTQAALTFPTATVLTGPTVTFQWSTVASATGYRLLLGTTPGANNLYGSGTITGSSATAGRLPTNGEPIYVRLYTVYGSVEAYTDYTFTAYTAP